jgi:hypothetical protein
MWRIEGINLSHAEDSVLEFNAELPEEFDDLRVHIRDARALNSMRFRHIARKRMWRNKSHLKADRHLPALLYSQNASVSHPFLGFG